MGRGCNRALFLSPYPFLRGEEKEEERNRSKLPSLRGKREGGGKRGMAHTRVGSRSVIISFSSREGGGGERESAILSPDSHSIITLDKGGEKEGKEEKEG